MCDGYWRDKEQTIQLSWEQKRWQTFYTVYVQLDKKSRRKFNKPQDLIRFSWEKQEVSERPTKEETIEARKKLGEKWD